MRRHRIYITPPRKIQEILATYIFEKYFEKVDMADFRPVDIGLPFTLLTAVQQIFVQVQNLYEKQRDQLRDQLNGQCKTLPRSYKDIQDLEKNMTTKIRAGLPPQPTL
jgi:hypothetical protein